MQSACRSKKIAAELTRDAGATVATVIRNGWEPIDDYPGTGKPMAKQVL
jgi:hypothetical protein